MTDKRFSDNLSGMDWKNIMADLSAAGFKQTQIAETCGCSQSTVSDLANGEIKQPNFALGQSLIALHRKAARRLKRDAKYGRVEANCKV